MKEILRWSAAFIILIFLSAAFATQISAAVVINEVYGAGGNSGAVLNRDFVELYNNGSTDVNISGFSLQYTSAGATGTTYTVCDISATATDTVIEPGTYFLIVTGTVGANGSALPGANATCSNISMAATAGKVALVSNTTALSGTSGCPTTGATVVDFVGYGTTATCFEGAGPAAAPSTTTSTQRTPVGTDSNNNNLDFQAAAPTPQAALVATAATAMIGGRVTAGSRGVSRAMVMLTGGDLEEPMYAMTNFAGQYRFEDLTVGETYVVQVLSKRYRFANPSVVVSVLDNVTNADFAAATK